LPCGCIGVLTLLETRALKLDRVGAYGVNYERHVGVRFLEVVQQGDIFFIHND
jgi:hypothetical protein